MGNHRSAWDPATRLIVPAITIPVSPQFGCAALYRGPLECSRQRPTLQARGANTHKYSISTQSVDTVTKPLDPADDFHIGARVLLPWHLKLAQVWHSRGYETKRGLCCILPSAPFCDDLDVEASTVGFT